MSRSYLEIIEELTETVNTDSCIPAKDKEAIHASIELLLNLLWKYSI
jgi:hypothetical protein